MALKCPKGHDLPNPGCSAIFCKLDNKRAIRKEEKQHIKETKELEVMDFKAEKIAGESEYNKNGESTNKLDAIMGARSGAEILEARRMVREELVPVEQITDPAEIEKFAETKRLQLLPRAFAELEYALKYGDDKTRRETALDVLAANGLRNKNEQMNANATVIFMPGANAEAARQAFSLPFKRGKIVDAEPVKTLNSANLEDKNEKK